MPKQYNEEIAKLKRHQYWTNRELKEVNELLKFKGEQIGRKIKLINEAKESGRYGEISQHDEWRIRYLKEQEALISLQCRLHTEQGETGREILKLRRGFVTVSTDSASLTKLNNIHWACSKLLKLRKAQMLVKVGLNQWRRMQQQVLDKKPVIMYRGTAYPLALLPWTIEQINRRVDAYLIDQKNNGEIIIRMRDIIAKDELQKHTYRQLIKSIKLARSGKI